MTATTRTVTVITAARASQRQRNTLLTRLRKQADTRVTLRQEQETLQKQIQRLRDHRLWLQLQVRLDRALQQGK